MTRLIGVRYPRAVLGGFLVAALCACGGGGDGGSINVNDGSVVATSISVSPGLLEFTVQSGEISAYQRIDVQYKGSGVVVGYAPGVAEPSWLYVRKTGTATATNATFDISVNQPSLAPGTYRSSLRFVTGTVLPGGTLEHASNITYTDLPISLKVIRFKLMPTGLFLELPEGGVTPKTGDLQLDLDADVSWTAVSNQPWLTIDKSSGTGPTTLRYSVSPENLPSGAYSGTVTVSDNSGRTVVFSAEMSVRPTRITALPGALVFEITTNASVSARTRILRVSDEFDGAAPGRALVWDASSSVPWLSLSENSGGTSPSEDLVVTVPAEVLATMTNNVYKGQVLIDYTTADSVSRRLSVPVELRVSTSVTEVSIVPQDVGRTVLAQGTPLKYRGYISYAHGYRLDRTHQLSWNSSNTAVASVGDGSARGSVQPVGAGEVTISATWPDTGAHDSFGLVVEEPSFVTYISDSSESGKIHQLVADSAGHLQSMGNPTVSVGRRLGSLTFTPDGRFAYAISGLTRIAQFSVQPSGSLSSLPVPHMELEGNSAQALTVDSEGRYIYALTAGSPRGVLRLDVAADGSLSMQSTLPVPSGSGNRSLAMNGSGTYLYSPDFDSDKVFQYSIGENGTLTALPDGPETGRFPVDIGVHPSGAYVYVVNFNNSARPLGAISQYRVGPGGLLQPMGLSALQDSVWGRRLLLTPDGTFAFLTYTRPDIHGYAGETGIATFAVAADGALIPRHEYQIPYPRSMAVDPAGQILYVTIGADKVLQFQIGSDASLLEDQYVQPVPNPSDIVVRKLPGAP